jgi:DNA invertase Pin-like site-specific DNA recombinase
MIRAFAYLRVSGRGQIEGDGFKRQEIAIRAYAEAHGLKVSKVFREEGISGTSERAKAQHGKCEGRKLYGFRAGEADVIAQMKALRESGTSFRQIATVLNAERIKTRTTGKRWYGSAVSQILRRSTHLACLA